MVIVQLIVALLIIVTLIWVLAYGLSLSRKAKSEAEKNFISRYFVILVVTFAVGGIIRAIQQGTGYKWLDGLVAIFLGLFVALWGVPLFWRIIQNKIKGLKGFLFFLPGLLFILLGLAIIYLGIRQIWEALA